MTNVTLKLIEKGLGIGCGQTEEIVGSNKDKGKTVANQEQLDLLKQGVEVWNQWRQECSSVEVDLIGANLSSVDLSNANLRGANLGISSLIDANLSGANLGISSLIGANLSSANLIGADLSSSDLRGAKLSGANLSSANLSGVNLFSADLIGANLRDANLSSSDLSDADLSGADLSGADLSGADLSDANLDGIDLSNAILSGIDFSNANLSGIDLSGDKLSKIDLSSAELFGVNLRGVNLSRIDLSGIDFSSIDVRDIDLSGIDFRGVNLSEIDLSDDLRDINLWHVDLSDADLHSANLSSVNLNGVNFSNANLSAVNLTQTQALATNFTGATFTGACLEDWNINSETNLDSIICEYVYLKRRRQERRPSSGSFKPGEFTALFQKALETVDLIFADGIDWKAFFASFQELQAEYGDSNLSIQAIEKKSGGAFVIRLEVSPELDKATIEYQAKQLYEGQIRQLEERVAEYRNDVRYFRQSNTNLERIIQTMAENQSPKYDLRGSNIGSLIDTAQAGSQQSNVQYINMSQDLTQAAQQIQDLLQQLQNQGVTVEDSQQQVADGIAKQAEANPALKEKLMRWGKAMANKASETTVSEAAKIVFTLALKAAGVS